jgi:hypothetical protein
LLAVYRRIEQIRDFLRCARESDEQRVVRQFTEGHGYPPDLQDPKTWSEKIQWMKLHDHDPRYTRCSDKYRVRQYVEETVGPEHLVPLLGVCDDARQLDLERLPPRFAVKANHGSAWNVLVLDKQHQDRNALVRRCNKWLARNYYVNHREWQYKNIEPLLVVEELLTDEEGRLPADFKIHCFDHGRGEIVCGVDRGRFDRHTRDHYDERWNRLDLKFKFPQSDEGLPRPALLEPMVSVARRLAAPFRYVRVDLYAVRGRIFVGELTFTPGSGYDPFVPERWDADWGGRFAIGGPIPPGRNPAG